MKTPKETHTGKLVEDEVRNWACQCRKKSNRTEMEMKAQRGAWRRKWAEKETRFSSLYKTSAYVNINFQQTSSGLCNYICARFYFSRLLCLPVCVYLCLFQWRLFSRFFHGICCISFFNIFFNIFFYLYFFYLYLLPRAFVKTWTQLPGQKDKTNAEAPESFLKATRGR